MASITCTLERQTVPEQYVPEQLHVEQLESQTFNEQIIEPIIGLLFRHEPDLMKA